MEILYTPTKGKCPYIKGWNKGIGAEKTCDNFYEAALIVPEGIVVVDFDGDNKSKNGDIYDTKIVRYICQKYRPYWVKSQQHHYHLYFKIPEGLKIKNDADYLTVGGFQVDYRKKGGAAVVKVDGEMRQNSGILTPTTLENLPTLPLILYPLQPSSGNISFIGLIEHDGRDELIWKHICKSKRVYPMEDIKETMLFINNILFKEPLDEEIVLSKIERAHAGNINEDSLCQTPIKPKELICFADVETVEPKWLWYPYIPLGTLVLLVGDPGIGKSYIALKIAAIVSNGENFPFSDSEKNTIKEPSKVIFQNGEDGVSYTLSLRLDKLNANKNNIFMINESEEVFKLNQVEALEEVIKKTNCKLIVIDPIQRYLPDGKSMDKANEVRSSLSPLINLAERYECTIIIIMHRNKNSSNSSLYRALGSIDFVGACRSMLSVEKRDSKTYIIHDKSSLGEKGKTICYEIDSYGLEFVEQLNYSDLEDNNSKKIETAIDFLKNILSAGKVSFNEILISAKLEGISETTLKRAKKLLDVKSAQKDRQWYWYLKDELKTEEEDKYDNESCI